jgi:hypothetical protein
MKNFGLFTKLYFKMITNIICAPKLYQFMLELWERIYQSHQEQQMAGDVTEMSFEGQI